MPASDRPRGRGVHYGWIILVVGTLVVMGSIGLARFGYTMILPPMQAALGLSNTQTGAVATGNFVGYLALGVIGGFIASRYGPRRVIAVSLLLTGVTMVLTGRVNGFAGALLLRTLTGVGSGGSNVPVMSLLSAWYAKRRRGLATGIAVSGTSLALIAMGPLVPRILARYGEDGWRASWTVLGGFVVLLALVAWRMLRNRPAEVGLRPIGAGAESSEVGLRPIGLGTESSEVRAGPTSSFDWRRVVRSGPVWRLALVYTAFGFSYVIYATFFAKYLQAEGGYSREAAGDLWALVGWASVFCGLIWGTVSDLIGRGYGLALVCLTQAASYAIFALWRAPAGYTLSTVLFGLTAWSIPGIVAAACGDYVGARLAPAALGLLTLFFGLGQVAGPSVAGALADASGSFVPAFSLAAGIALLGAFSSLLLGRPRKEDR